MDEAFRAERNQQRELSIVVACLNEAENIEFLHRRLTDACRSLVADYEIILINDGSRDETWDRMSALADSDSPCRRR
jgi:polyisoprenyl-phosphate glycosyltransferase